MATASILTLFHLLLIDEWRNVSAKGNEFALNLTSS
jgi:hypothetical protein